MPTYQYACKDCGEQLEVVQSFSDDSLTICPQCQGSLRKVWGSVGVVFKGSGFYRNDSRGGSSSSLPASGDSGSSSDSNGSGGSSDSNGSSSTGDSSSSSSSGSSSTPAASSTATAAG